MGRNHRAQLNPSWSSEPHPEYSKAWSGPQSTSFSFISLYISTLKFGSSSEVGKVVYPGVITSCSPQTIIPLQYHTPTPDHHTPSSNPRTSYPLLYPPPYRHHHIFLVFPIVWIPKTGFHLSLHIIKSVGQKRKPPPPKKNELGAGKHSFMIWEYKAIILNIPFVVWVGWFLAYHSRV